MATGFDKVADEFLKTPEGAKINDKKAEINKLISSPDGQKVKKMLEGGQSSLADAASRGDIDTLKTAVSGILKTEEGARLAEQIMKMMK